MTVTRIGVLGAGVIARRHVRTLARFADARVCAVADVQVDRARELAVGVGARAYDDARAMLDREGLDAVYVCVPPFAHGDLDLELVRRGLPMFVEKPVAADLATAERVASAVEQAGLVTGVGHHWRWLDTVERAQELLADRPARLATGYWLDATPPISWWQRQDGSGGQFVEQATHVVDLARLLVGEVEEVFAYTARTSRAAFPDMDTADVTAASARFSTGAVGSFAATCLLGWPHRVGLHLFGDGIALELSEKELRIDLGEGPAVLSASGDPFEREDRAFLDAVQGHPDRTRTTYAEALRTQRVTTAALRSAAEGRPVPIGSTPAARE
jgi:predicted dehydrogenase